MNLPFLMQARALLKRESNVSRDSALFVVGEQHIEARARVEDSDPETSPGSCVPPAGRIAIQVNPAGVGEANRSDV
jgi:hypothetical protein